MKNSAFHRSNWSLIHWPDGLWKSVAWTVIVCFTVNCVTPAVVAAKTLAKDAKLYAAPTKTEFDLASDALIALEETLDRMDRRLYGKFEFAWQETLSQKSHAKPPAAAKRADLAPREADLDTNLAQLDGQQGALQSYFAQTQADLKSHNIADTIQKRARDQSDQYGKMYSQLKDLLKSIKSAKTDADYQAAVTAAASFLQSHSSKPKRAKFDPNHLAFGPPKERPRQALTDAAALRAALGLSGTQGSSTAASVAQADSSRPSKAVVSSAKQTKPAAMFANVIGGSSSLAALPANLSPTEDVQITQAIKDKAQALNNNALAIYQFVRNNVEYMPTYGSIQGSDYTLQTLRGNDMDQASLLIALLRAANIPAHYVYGTIQVPIDQVENWVGGVTDPMAALDLMGQGGIPTLGLAQGGVIKYAQIEHVWVEAQIGIAPGRGAITTSGTTWVPMDPSFKQYTYTQGMNLQTAVPFDAHGFANTIQSTSTINTAEGWLQNVDQNYINTQLTNYQTQVTNYVSSQNASATFGDVIGTKAINAENLPMLAGTLPYAVKAKASTLDALPDTLRWAFHYQVDGQELLNRSLPSLAGHLMALSFSPATAQDETAFESYLPRNITDLNQLPTRLPADVVQLTAAFSIDGQTTAIGPMYGLGEAMTITKGLFRPNSGWQDTEKILSAGEYQAICVVGISMSDEDVSARQKQAQDALNKFQTTQYDALNGANVTGAVLHTVSANYFAQVTAHRRIATRTVGGVEYPLPSFGTISTNSDTTTFLSIPTSVSPKGVMIDMDRVAASVVDKKNDHAKSINLNRVVGAIASHAESGILDQQFSSSGQSSAAVSTIKLLTTADIQGQHIYTLDSSNASVVLSLLQLPDEVLSEIADSVNAGFAVTTSANLVNYGGQTTAGYIVCDPASGGASYKIVSGQDGGRILFAIGFILLLFVMGCLFPAIGIIAFQLLVAQGFVGELAIALTEVVETLLICLKAVDLGKDAAEILDKCDSIDAICVILALLMIAGVEVALGPAPLLLDYMLFGVIDVGIDVCDHLIESTCVH